MNPRYLIQFLPPVLGAVFIIFLAQILAAEAASLVKIPETGQNKCYTNTGPMHCPDPGSPFFGQDAQFSGREMAYKDNGDGTITDLVTGLTWSQAVSAEKLNLDQALKKAETMSLGGHSD